MVLLLGAVAVLLLGAVAFVGYLLRLLGFSDLYCRIDERAIKNFIEIFRDF